ncbi:hypothetical protein CsSME_00001570 [Camellia sinensis var. sinensis]
MLALEATLEQNMKMVDNSVYKLFQGNREQMKNAKGDVSILLIIGRRLHRKSTVREATEVENNISTDEFANGLTEATVDKCSLLGDEHSFALPNLQRMEARCSFHSWKEDGNILPDGSKIKKGDGVNYVAYAMGRIAYFWDAEEFHPLKFTAFQVSNCFSLSRSFDNIMQCFLIP